MDEPQESDAVNHHENVSGTLPQADEKHLALFTAIEGAYKGTDWARCLNANLVKDYHGPAYGTEDGEERPVNKLNQAVDVWTMMVAANNPHVSVTTPFDTLRPFAKHYEQAMNDMVKEIHLSHTIRRWVLDAFFLMGVVKVHLKDSAPVMVETDMWMDPGTPFASNVSLDDFVFDGAAKKWSEVKYAGDMYRIPFSDIAVGVENGMYNEEVAAVLRPNSKYQTEDAHRLEDIAKGDVTDADEYESMIDLCDVWVARDRKVYTFAVNDRSKFSLKKLPPLAEMEWTDPFSGPYHLLGFNDVPENIIPLSPISNLQALDRTINTLFAKMMKQALRQKEVPVYTPSAKDSIQAIKDAPDGFAVKADPKEIGMWSSGGAHQGNQAFALLLIELMNNLAGNIDGIAGLGPQAKTVGQEQLIHDASNRKVGQMQQRVVEATTGLIQSLGYMLWEDEFKTITSEFSVGGYSLQSEWKPGDREGNFLQYNFDIGVYSMTYRPPAARAESNLLILERFMPAAEMMMAQGGMYDFAAIIDSLADDLDSPELRRFITFTTPPQQTPLSPKDGLAPPNKTTTNVRQNVSAGATPQSRLQEMQQNLQGAAPPSGVSMPMGGGV
jgi:hypothetical protein